MTQGDIAALKAEMESAFHTTAMRAIEAHDAAIGMPGLTYEGCEIARLRAELAITKERLEWWMRDATDLRKELENVRSRLSAVYYIARGDDYTHP